MKREADAPAGAISVLWSFRSYGRPYRSKLLAGLACRAVELIADLAQPWPLAIIVDGVLGRRRLHGVLATISHPFDGSPATLLAAAVAGSILFAIVSGAVDYFGDRLMNGAGERITAAVRTDVFSHLQRLPLTYHDANAVGELTSRVAVDTDNIEDALIEIFSTLVPGILSVTGLLVTLLVISRPLGLVACATAPCVFAVAVKYNRISRLTARTRRRQEGYLSASVTETLTGIHTVHALNAHDIRDRRFGVANEQTLAAGLRSVEVRARFTPLVEVTAAVGFAGVLWLGAQGVLDHRWSLGVLLVATAYVRSMLKPMRSLAKMSFTLSRAAAAAERVTAVLAEDQVETTRPAPPIWAPRDRSVRVRGEVALENVSFSYDRGAVLRDLSLHAEPGERVALVGPNGTGKSTVLALVAGLYRPDEGEVLIDGIDARSYDRAWLRLQFAIVPQETYLFSGTIWDNLRYARPTASAPEVHAAARASRVAEFVERMPRSYGTVLGDQGSGLSGGQRQRLAIARALLRDAPVVLLDEPTSNLDAEAEAVVVEALQPLMEGRTVIMATHRPALLGLADRVVQFEGDAPSGVTRVGRPGRPIRRRPPATGAGPADSAGPVNRVALTHVVTTDQGHRKKGGGRSRQTA